VRWTLSTASRYNRGDNAIRAGSYPGCNRPLRKQTPWLSQNPGQRRDYRIWATGGIGSLLVSERRNARGDVSSPYHEDVKPGSPAGADAVMAWRQNLAVLECSSCSFLLQTPRTTKDNAAGHHHRIDGNGLHDLLGSLHEQCEDSDAEVQSRGGQLSDGVHVTSRSRTKKLLVEVQEESLTTVTVPALLPGAEPCSLQIQDSASGHARPQGGFSGAGPRLLLAFAPPADAREQTAQ
jgi:hypothetical protein